MSNYPAKDAYNRMSDAYHKATNDLAPWEYDQGVTGETALDDFERFVVETGASVQSADAKKTAAEFETWIKKQ